MSKEKMIKPKFNVLARNPGTWRNRILIGTPTTGLVRFEWVLGRFGQIIPVNWSSTDAIQWLSTYGPMGYLVADAQNIIAQIAVEKDFEWLLLVESDNILPPNAFERFNEYMRKADVPIVSGLYFTKSDPPEPLVFRGRGNSFYTKWKMGDKIWCDGVPTGCLLIHCSILKAMWKDSPEYAVAQNTITRRIFDTPAKSWFDPELGGQQMLLGTSDLQWCTRIMSEDFFTKAGWSRYAKKQYPFLIDTNIFSKHISEDGRIYPLQDPKQLGF